MAKALEVIGEVACLCGERVPLKQQGHGLAMYKCDWCDVSVQSHGNKSDSLLRALAGGKPAAVAVAPEAVTAASPATGGKILPRHLQR